MPIQPSQVVSRSNSDSLRILAVLEQRHIPAAQRMAAVVAIADEYRAAVAGSTHDPLRGSVRKLYVQLTRTDSDIETGYGPFLDRADAEAWAARLERTYSEWEWFGDAYVTPTEPADVLYPPVRHSCMSKGGGSD